jgi:hypothetical protein
MSERILGVLVMAALIGCGVVDPDTYKKSGSTYGRSDGWYEDSSHTHHLMVSGASVFNITSGGVVSETISTGAGAITFSSADASIVMNDNDSTALLMGSTGQLGLLTLDTGNGTETVVVNGTTTQTALHVNVGDAQFDEDIVATGSVTAASATITGDVGSATVTASTSVKSPIVATTYSAIRFCGNGINGATASYLGPVPQGADSTYATGGAGCDGLDNTTEATADEAWLAGNLAFYPVAMVCAGLCTAAGGANDAITYQLRDDTADVTGMTCAAGAWTGDGVLKQCKVSDETPVAVAAASKLAVKMAGTDDDCTAAGDDFECIVYVTF